MPFFPQFKKAILLLSMLTLLYQSSVAQEHVTHETYPRNAIWTDLIFEGSKFFTEVKLHMQLSSADCKAEEFPLEGQTKTYNCSKTADNTMLLSISSSAKGPGLSGDQYEENIVFNKTTFQPYRRILKNNINEEWIKIYYWGKTGVYRQKILPANSHEKKQPPDTWTKRKVSFYRYPKEADECSTISDPLLLLYIVSTLESDVEQEPVKLCAFGKGQIHQLTIRQEQSSPLKVSYTKHSSSREIEVEDQRSPLVFSIGVKTFTPADKKQEQFSFFGLHKDIHIYLDPETHLPLRISGKNNIAGQLVLNLTKVTENISGF
jgi:hypothetical protein